MSEHPDRLLILGFIDNDPFVDRPRVTSHLKSCSDCRDVFDDLQQFVLLLAERDIHQHLADSDSDRPASYASLLAESEAIARDSAAAEEFFAELLGRPIETWDEMLAAHPQRRTSGMARRLIAEIEAELNRRPEQALLLADVAERMVPFIAVRDRDAVLGDIWKNRSNGLRHLGHYEEALAAATRAEAFYDSISTGAFDLAQAQYTRAATLFKMTRYAEALQVVTAATITLRDFGPSVPLAKTMILDAAVRFEQGDVGEAQKRWRDVLPLLERFDDRIEEARVLANLAECNLRLGDSERALANARAAVARYRELRMDAESIRSEWTIAMVHLARGDSEEGLRLLENAAAAFTALGMSADAGFVKLDAVEELLRQGNWTQAETTARELATLFTAAGVTAASVMGIDFLRQAVENREATVATIEYVRDYVSAEDDSRVFAPPGAGLQ
jgi:tetratricopeptide (TPR) repeat protein